MRLILFDQPNTELVAEKFGEDIATLVDNVNRRARNLLLEISVEVAPGAYFSVKSEKEIDQVLRRIKSYYVSLMEKYNITLETAFAVLVLDEENYKRMKHMVARALEKRTIAMIESLEKFIEFVKGRDVKQRRKLLQRYREFERIYMTHMQLHNMLGIYYSALDTLHKLMNTLRVLFAGVRK